MKIWTLEEEAERLKARFEKINRAAWARAHKFNGGPALIYQHINGRRPIGRDAALVYAKGFNVPLAAISPRLAKEVADINAQFGEDNSPNAKVINESTIDNIANSKEIQEIIALMLVADIRGQRKMISAAHDALELHLAHKKMTQSYVSNEQMLAEIEEIKKINTLMGEPPNANVRQPAPSKRPPKH